MDSHDIARYRDIIAGLLRESPEDMPSAPGRKELEQAKQQKLWRKEVRDRWEKRRQRQGRSTGPVSTTFFIDEFVRPGMVDEHGDPVLIEIQLEVSGTYRKGQRASRWDPGEPDNIEDLELDWVKPVHGEPEGGPLTFRDLLAIEEIFETDEIQERIIDKMLEGS
jgi:hypothetical protein